MTRTKVMSSFLLTKLLDDALPVLEERYVEWTFVCMD